MNQIPITRNGSELLKAELKQLKSIDRPNIVQAIAEARAQGDLSENAEYDAAKERQGFIEGRLAQIEAILSQAIVIDPTSLNAGGKCVFGSTVQIEDLDEETKFTYQIVGDDEADIKDKKISINSPLAKAMIGKEESDVIDFESPGGLKNYEIIKISYI
jgi:transcription elongation factor GreA